MNDNKHLIDPSAHRTKKDSNIPSPRENKIILMPHPRTNTDNQIPTPPHALTYVLLFISVKLHG